MGAIAILKELVEWVLIIPKLVKLNADRRQEIRDAVGGVADELIRGVDLVTQRIEGLSELHSRRAEANPRS